MRLTTILRAFVFADREAILGSNLNAMLANAYFNISKDGWNHNVQWAKKRKRQAQRFFDYLNDRLEDQ